MFNVLLDRLPTTYKGYLIRTDFRVGIQLYTCFKDTSLTDEEKYFTMFKLLYGNGIPRDIQVALDGFVWFMYLGNPPKKKNESESSNTKEVLDFEIDATKIYSSFKYKFGIDLNKEKMHWFQFRYLMMELRDCHLSDVIEIREKSIDKCSSKEERDWYQKYKKQYAIEPCQDDEDILENIRKTRCK